jgi:hypothetical protein
MKRVVVSIMLLGALIATNAHAIPRPCDCFGGLDPDMSPTYWSLTDQNGYTLEDGDWVYVAWKGPDGIINLPKRWEPHCGDVTGDDVIIGEGTVSYGYFTITVTTYAPEDGQHPWTGEEIYCRLFNEPKYPACATGYYGDSDQHTVQNIVGETFFAKFPGHFPPYYGASTPWLLPVELMSFEAIGGDGQVLLEWKTASEVNNFGFHIERSLDEFSFERITQEVIPGAGNSATENTYAYMDISVVNETTYYYNLISVDMDGLEEVANESPVSATPLTAPPEARVPIDFFLRQNYPNPFNPLTEITYAIPRDVSVTLKIYNVLGAEAAILVDDDQEAGFYTVRWDAVDVTSGVYFCTLSAGNFKAIKKMVLLK